jgi:transposase InsO family protein
VVGGFPLADGTRAKALTGVDDHSRFCVSAHLMLRETSGNVCDGLATALRAYGVPQQILTDNGKVFTGRFGTPVVEVLFDRICRENGIEHLLTQPRSPTTTGKIERFHRAIRTEFRTDRVFASLPDAQAELDAWVGDYNHHRPHQALDMATPAQRFQRPMPATVTPLRITNRADRWWQAGSRPW